MHGIPQPAAQGDQAGRADLLVLLTASPAVLSQDAQRSGELQRVRYAFTSLPTGNTLAMQRAVAATSGQQAEHFMLLHDQVQAFHLRYFDGEAWSDEWQQAELPRALEITIVLQGAGPQSRTYQFATLVTAD